jgi:hypothetical protein
MNKNVDNNFNVLPCGQLTSNYSLVYYTNVRLDECHHGKHISAISNPTNHQK